MNDRVNMPGIDVRMVSYGDRVPIQDRYNSEESLEDNQSTTSSTESRQSDFSKKEHEFIPTRSSGILAGKPAAKPGQFTRINSNPLLISAQKQMLLVEEVKKKKEEVKVGEDIPDWQSNLDGWKLRRRKQSEDAFVRVSEMQRTTDHDFESSSRRKSSLGRKISLQIENDDQINFDDLGEDADEDADASKADKQIPQRRDNRAVSQERVIPEEAEEENREEENQEDMEKNDDKNGATSNPYENAIQGYKSFAMSRNTASSSKESSPSSSSSATSSLSSSSPPRKEEIRKGDEEWEERIETFVQPTRRTSTEVSETMRQKMASFSGRGGKEKESSPPVRSIKADNKFKDKLNAFKTIETAAVKDNTPSPPVMSRRESEPILSRPRASMTQMKPSLTSSSSSSFMNTMQNAKFFQMNSLGGEEEEEDTKAMEDALEESFNVLEEGKEEPLVFSADDFIPTVGKFAPPQEKPPPLPAAPPPQTVHEEETEIDKQEREIIESLEREEKEHKKYLETLTPNSITVSSSSTSSSFSSSSSTSSSVVTEEKSSVSTQSSLTSSKSVASASGSGAKKHESASGSIVQPRKKDKEEKDYSKHWLIQEAEQRRIAEAKQKHNLNLTGSSSGIEKLENINNNNINNNNNNDFVGQRKENKVSDNIYANVDAANLNFNKNHSPFPSHIPESGSGQAPIPGPQVPPRLGEGGDRVLSVSGRKKCSHCKEELGRGAAMIIESLRLFYHIRCFKCCVCSIQLGNGEQGTDVRVRNNRLHCQNCYSNDEGLKFSKV